MADTLSPNTNQGNQTSSLGNWADQIGQFCGTSPTTSQVLPNWYDPLGPSAVGPKGQPLFSPTGGPQQRSAIFNMLSGLQPTLASNSALTAGALQSGAASPGFGQARDLASSEIAGNYLHGSPELDSAMSAMRANAGADSANTAARLKSSYAQNGMSFGTPQMAALENNQAVNTAQANNTETQARLSNYQTERSAQDSAGGRYQAATDAPINYLSSMNNAYLAPMTQMGQLVSGLSSGGQVVQPDSIVKPGATSSALGAIGQL